MDIPMVVAMIRAEDTCEMANITCLTSIVAKLDIISKSIGKSLGSPFTYRD